MMPWATAQTFLRDHACNQRAAKATESAAAVPKRGQVSPNTSGSATSSRAIVGRKVAGTM